MIVELPQESFIVLEPLRELSLELTDRFEELVEDRRGFLDVSLRREPILDGGKERLCSFCAAARFCRGGGREKEFIGGEMAAAVEEFMPE